MHNNESKVIQQFNMGWKTACCKPHQSIDRLWGRYQELVELGKSPRPRANWDLADVCRSKVHNSCFLLFSSPPLGFLADCSVSQAAVITSHPNVCATPPRFFCLVKKKKESYSDLACQKFPLKLAFSFAWSRMSRLLTKGPGLKPDLAVLMVQTTALQFIGRLGILLEHRWQRKSLFFSRIKYKLKVSTYYT